MASNVLRQIYASTPNGLMRPISLIPFSWRVGRSYRQTGKMLERSQWLSKEVFESYQVSKLRALLTYAYEKVPYYRDLFRHIPFDLQRMERLSDIECIPLLSRKDVFESLDRICSKDYTKVNSYVAHTGGTTGQPLKLKFSVESHFVEWAFMHTQWQRAGYTTRCRRVALLGVPFRDNRATAWKYNYFHNELQLSPRHLDREHLEEHVGRIVAFRPHFLYGLPSAICVLAKYVAEKGLVLKGLKGILCGSENLTNEQHELLEATFNATVYSWYGQTEKVVLGGQCEHSKDYHLFPEYGYTELVDEEGGVIRESGRIGEIVGTGFINRAMPLIRYRTDDFGVYASGACPCGRQYVRLRKVIGRRNDDFLVTADRKKILFSSIETQIGVFGHVYQWQFYQDRPGEVKINIMPNRVLTEKNLREIEAELNGQVENRIRFEALVVDDLIRSKTGKVKNIVQKIDSSDVDY